MSTGSGSDKRLRLAHLIVIGLLIKRHVSAMACRYNNIHANEQFVPGVWQPAPFNRSSHLYYIKSCSFRPLAHKGMQRYAVGKHASLDTAVLLILIFIRIIQRAQCVTEYFS